MSCKNCLYARNGPINATSLQKQLLCYFEPPKVFPIMQGNNMGTMNARPMVQEDDFCVHDTTENVEKMKKPLRFE